MKRRGNNGKKCFSEAELEVRVSKIRESKDDAGFKNEIKDDHKRKFEIK